MTRVQKKWLGEEVDITSIVVKKALHCLTCDLHPMSATGGWLPTRVLVKATGLHENSIRDRLVEMEEAGLVERRRFSSSYGGTGYLWRLVVKNKNTGISDGL